MTGSTVRTYPSASVVIATRNRPTDVERALQALLECRYPTFEVLLVTETGETGTTAESLLHVLHQIDPSWHAVDVAAAASEVAEWAFASETPNRRVRLLLIGERGVSAARNAGARRAVGEVLAFTDDDCTVHGDWLERVGAVFSQAPEIGLICGALTAAPHDPSQMHVPVFEPRGAWKLRTRLVRPWSLGVGANMAIPRSTFLQLGGFDTRLGGGTSLRSSEDINLTYRVLRRGMPVLIDGTNQVVHWGARPIADGSSHNLLTGSWFGFGANYGLLAGDGDLAAVVPFLRELGSGVAGLALDVSRGRRANFGLVASAVNGFVTGVRLGLAG
jgi:glycosyltransferase involved in cell wall biosynthesis